MEITGLIAAIKDWTPSTILAIAIFVITYFFKQFDKQAKKDSEQNENFKKSLNLGLQRIEETLNDKMHQIDEKIVQLKEMQNKQERAIEALKSDKLERTDFYRDMGGWRNEINNLNKLIVSRTDQVQNSIVDLWKKLSE